MTIKSIFFAVAVAALVGAAIASCPNACSGHGSCGNHDRCTCYANFVGGDCSEKACPYGRSGQECSGRGTCDRGAGSCECADGYSGASCQRTSCPNDCSGKGSCDTTTGMCSCAGGYSGNDCGTRLCPKGDDPLTHEVENSGDGTASQQSEVQTVTFNAGRGLGGTATLTFNDLYGQSWTTRPFSVGGDNVYRLEIAVVPEATSQNIEFTYNGATSAGVVVHSGNWDGTSPTITAETIRAAVTSVLDFGGTISKPIAGNDRASVVYVRKHHSATSAKLGGSIHAAARVTFDIYLPIDMSTHDDNGALLNGLGVQWASSPTANTASLSLNTIGDRSAEIADALTSLPNQVIPSVTVTKVDVTDSDTASSGATGNAYAQSYSIQFSDSANAGDQNMLQCNAAPCDDSGCINRGTGVSETRYMYHDHANHGEGINFNNRGYFIMDIGKSTDTDAELSAGTIRIMWDTGVGISSAEFAVVATAAEVQTALRTITGWEAVDVVLWGSVADPTAVNDAGKLLVSHQFKVTFAAGYDDYGRSPTFKTLSSADGNYAAATNSPTAKLYDQRFSNSVWLGKTTGYMIFTQASATAGITHYASIASGATLTAIPTMAENGDVWKVSDTHFGAGGADGVSTAVKPATTTNSAVSAVHYKNALTAFTTANSGVVGQLESNNFGTRVAGTNFAYLYEGATSQQSSDYFAVGSTIEVLGTDMLGDGANSAPVTKNQYRKFKVTGHFTNAFNKEFAKLDSFPGEETVADTAGTFKDINYLLKITSNNGTVHNYNDVQVRVNVEEVQVLVIGTGATGPDDEVFTLAYKGELTADMNYASTAENVAEEINSFSSLSGPVTVSKTNFVWTITFDAKDGDVALLTPSKKSGTNAVTTFTKHNGWSIEAPVGYGLDTMQAGGLVNISAVEVCKFTATTADPTGAYFCYGEVCGQEVTISAGNLQTALLSIRDDNGVSILAGMAQPTAASQVFTITLPSPDLNCDNLEMRVSTAGSATALKKEVTKNDNGHQFRITRSFLQKQTPAVSGATVGAVTFTAEASLNSAVANVDSIIISDKSTCVAAENKLGDLSYPISRTIDAVAGAVFGSVVDLAADTATAATGPTLTVTAYGGYTAKPVEDMTVHVHSCNEAENNGVFRIKSVDGTDEVVLKNLDGSDVTGLSDTVTNCVYVYGLGLKTVADANCHTSFGRHVITLDAKPSGSAYSLTKSLKYTSPVGGCSVAETTKGTYESYECSNRGACDGKSGLCTCYEGYSGQSCQTQTVLV